MPLEETVSPQHQNVPRHWSGVPGRRLSAGFPTRNPQPGTLPRPLSHLARASREARPRPQHGQENLGSEIFPDVSSDRSHCFRSANGSIWSPIFRQIRGRKLVCSCDLSLCNCRKEPLSPNYLPPRHGGLVGAGTSSWGHRAGKREQTRFPHPLQTPRLQAGPGTARRPPCRAVSGGGSPRPGPGLWEVWGRGLPAITQPGVVQISPITWGRWMAVGKTRRERVGRQSGTGHR